MTNAVHFMARLRPQRHLYGIAAAVVAAALAMPATSAAQATTQVVRLQQAHVSVPVLPARTVSSRGIVILSSGDAGWRSLSKDLGEELAGLGYDVVGIDSKDYLTDATRRAGSLAPAKVADDYLVLLDWVSGNFPRRPIYLVGVSEGAGLSIMAAADDRVGSRVGGILAIGTPDTVTLAWRFSDWIVWVTHQEPNEPSIPTAPYVAALSPVPLAFIHATGDEFVTVDQARKLFENATEPRRLEILPARNHRFSDARASLIKTVLACLQWSLQLSALRTP